MADATPTAALRSDRLSLQRTQGLPDRTPLRRATGLKANGTLDNLAEYFAAQGLHNRADDLAGLLDNMGQAIQVLKTADAALTVLASLLSQAQATARQAKDDAGAGAAQTSIDVLARAYDGAMTRIENLVGNSGHRGTNLLKGSVTMTVPFNEAGTSTLDVAGVDFTRGDGTAPSGLGVGNALSTGANAVGGTGWDITNVSGTIDASLTQIAAALATARNQAEAFGSSLNILQTREHFTQNIINTLKEGADKLTSVDKNEEGAKLLSLQTAQQRGIASLSLAAQANRAILKLFQ